MARARSAGLTFVEVLVALLVLSLVGIGISGVLRRAWQSQDVVQGQNDMQKRAQLAIDAVIDGETWDANDRLADGLRSACAVQAGSNGTSVEVQLLDPATSKYYYYRYRLLAGDLVRDYDVVSSMSSPTTVTVCRGVSSFIVRYYKRNDDWTLGLCTTPTDAASLWVSVTVPVPGYHAWPTQTSWVKLRNK